MNPVAFVRPKVVRAAHTPVQSALLNERSAANYLGLHTRTLQKGRQDGSGPTFIKLGRRIAYRQCDLDAWVEAHAVRSTADATMRLGAKA
ncbi:AlpA family transcriptional regulator [Acetobacter estunensis]|uniref:helix-turn-helix transcriptional regulator n=1 Tax=Acetobacter estunensis TaxID=104097 RepID=UPI001C2D9512|nr:helix-turn-helix domain-containing protein [Acetobacter estunensis]MBV1835742.1 helix-turn-helix domain-containing protein [Acetobacter estunensis]MBV1835997.1 helix-turn-helix domain-containing protein [Acetobacter estunensis]